MSVSVKNLDERKQSDLGSEPGNIYMMEYGSSEGAETTVEMAYTTEQLKIVM